ncbi:hypothetical protein SAMN04487911_12830 [Arenibacter nanhaiticus]|uniref:Uncharacterized protein n=1 Tax=Arenibacter nanhaiticus TaxID=558155 RepID=A0A1M6KX67_9FLAO|nr:MULTISPECIES: hypothetical protein [Arenibacter]NKI28318.1 hypothetical protein [Arenibacter sp. 6A1]SHJ63482.1 hypothetical protein SAMN04487911_12830 [Arenibacter nanhaiticus]
MNLYRSILEFLYKNQERGFVRITHICLDPNEATRIAKKMKEEGLIDYKQRRFMGGNGHISFISPPQLIITPEGKHWIETLELF